ncbi:polyketide synthase dehydratase domain-containing protein [Streptomyces sp. M19]
MSADALYAGMAEIGFDYGPAFQGVRKAWKADGDAYADVALPGDTGGESFGIHPALFDASLHTGLLQDGPSDTAFLPFSWSGVRVGRRGLSRVRVRMRRVDETAFGLDVVSEQGEPVLSLERLDMRPVDPAQLERLRRGGGRSVHRLDWAPSRSARAAPSRSRCSATPPPRVSGSLIWARWSGRWPTAARRRSWWWRRSPPGRRHPGSDTSGGATRAVTHRAAPPRAVTHRAAPPRAMTYRAATYRRRPGPPRPRRWPWCSGGWPVSGWASPGWRW